MRGFIPEHFEKVSIDDSILDEDPIEQLWLTSYTVDEYEAFATIYRILGDRLIQDRVKLTFDRSGYRRAGTGILPRNWLNPFSADLNSAYHPKLILAKKKSDCYELIISTGNLARDDFRQTQNVAIRFSVNKRIGETIAKWIENPKKMNRALCLFSKNNNYSLPSSYSNLSTWDQFKKKIEPCERCKRESRKFGLGQWLIASPFWSPGAINKIRDLDPEGSIKAYFRDTSVWNAISSSADCKSVDAYLLKGANKNSRWHHKIIARSCCNRQTANTLLYIGSANATMNGFFGINEKAINWEAGIIISGSKKIREQAESIALANLKRGRKLKPASQNISADENQIVAPENEWDDILKGYLLSFITISKTKISVKKNIRLPSEWNLVSKIFLLSNGEKPIVLTNEGRSINSPGYYRVSAVFAKADYKQTVEIDLMDFQPEADLKLPKENAIAYALSLLSVNREQKRGKRLDFESGIGIPKKTDIRFPFRLLYQNRVNALQWLERIANHPSDDFISELPKHWAPIASEMLKKWGNNAKLKNQAK